MKQNPIDKIPLGALVEWVKDKKWIIAAVGIGAGGGFMSIPSHAPTSCPRADVEMTHQQYADLIVGFSQRTIYVGAK